MQTNARKTLNILESSLREMDRLPRAIIKYGVRISLALMIAGCLVILLNHYTGYDSYKNFVGISIVKNSVTVLAEAIIGGLVIDFVLRRN